jgi:hypothetical protein
VNEKLLVLPLFFRKPLPKKAINLFCALFFSNSSVFACLEPEKINKNKFLFVSAWISEFAWSHVFLSFAAGCAAAGLG